MVNITIIAAGNEYQIAAAWAAPTYMKYLPQGGMVSVLLSDEEKPLELLKKHSELFGFAIKTFPFEAERSAKYIMQLKCRALFHVVSHLKSNELLFYVDADTCCCRPLTFESQFTKAAFAGKICFAPDLRDRHENNVRMPWYLSPGERDTYVNAGVMLTTACALDMFKLFLDISKRKQFSNPPYGDQTIINYVFGKYHNGRLFLLNRDYNEMRYSIPTSTKFVAHFPGGKAPQDLSKKFARHKNLCIEILRN